jgi:hypothetical protein
MGISKEIIKNILDKKEEFINSFDIVRISIRGDFIVDSLEAELEKENVSVLINLKANQGYVITIYENESIVEQSKSPLFEGYEIVDDLIEVFKEVEESREEKHKQKVLEEKKERVYNILFKD